MPIVTEIKTIKVESGCKDNPVFVSWINTLGGREHWLFHRIQVKQIDTADSGVFVKTNTELETATGNVFDITAQANNILIVNALVDIEDIEGIKTMLYSPCVEMLYNPETWQTETPKWLNVHVIKGSFKLYQTNQTKNVIEIQLQMPNINIQSQ
jgi:uncharacterized surface protein with fasciclin (FAS1) repeats